MMTLSAAVLNEYQGKDVAFGKPHLYHAALLVENDAYTGDLLRKRNKISTFIYTRTYLAGTHVPPVAQL